MFQPGVHQRAQRLRVADRGDPADDLAGGLADEVRVGPFHLAGADEGGHPGGVDPVRAAGQHQQRRAVRAEHQAVGDRPDLAAELGGRGRRGRGWLGQFSDFPWHAELTEHAGHLDPRWDACKQATGGAGACLAALRAEGSRHSVCGAAEQELVVGVRRVVAVAASEPEFEHAPLRVVALTDHVRHGLYGPAGPCAKFVW